MEALARMLDRIVGRVLSVLRWLAIPIGLLLFLQWPLRDIFRAWSRDANDLGQWLFALYVAMAFTAATRAHTHLAADAVARRYAAPLRGAIARLGILFGLTPWALFIVIGGAKLVIASLRTLETFPDTNNPGYFIIKLALWLLAGLILLQGAIDLTRPRGSP